MKKKIVVLSLLFVVFLIALTPMSLLETQIAKQKSIAVSGINGSLWSGNVAEIRAGNISLSNVDYENSFLALMTATLSTDLNIKSGDIKGRLSIEAGTDYQEKIVFEKVNLRMPAEMIAEFVNTLGAKINGNISTTNISALIERQNVSAVNGTGRWMNASVSFGGKNFELGNFVVNLSTDEKTKTITGKLQKSENKLGLEGEFTYTSNLLEASLKISINQL